MSVLLCLGKNLSAPSNVILTLHPFPLRLYFSSNNFRLLRYLRLFEVFNWLGNVHCGMHLLRHLSGICLVGKMSIRDVSGRGSVRRGCVWSGKCLSGKCPSGKGPSGMCPGILEFTFVLIIFARLLPICLLNLINMFHHISSNTVLYTVKSV